MRKKDIECMEKMEHIIQRFVELNENENDPERLPELLDRQKVRIDALLSEKNEVIAKLREEFDRMSLSYEDNAQKQVGSAGQCKFHPNSIIIHVATFLEAKISW